LITFDLQIVMTSVFHLVTWNIWTCMCLQYGLPIVKDLPILQTVIFQLLTKRYEHVRYFDSRTEILQNRVPVKLCYCCLNIFVIWNPCKLQAARRHTPCNIELVKVARSGWFVEHLQLT
jgi:hypothetical protein